MTEHQGELRPAYRTLNEPTKLLGLSIGGWVAVLGCGGIAYAWVMASPLPWRLNFSLVAIVLGGPLSLLLLREAAAISPARLLLAALRWRTRPTRLIAPSGDQPVRAGGVRVDRASDPPAEPEGVAELPWLNDQQRVGKGAA